VIGQPGPVGRDEAAAAAGIGRALAVYHLDKLVESGLLTASYSRPPGRSGPGAGRPAKLYARSDREFTVTVPPREYELAARLLVQAVEADPGCHSRVALAEAARRLGTELGSAFRPAVTDPPSGGRDAAERDVKGLLTQQGYEPCHGGGDIRLRNCPFHQLAEEHRDVVCGMNLALVEGLFAGLGADGWHPALDPRPGHCCVVIGGDRS
jgi:predicted ArsR family transcriptional regulator